MATITWPATIDSSMPTTTWRNDTSHSDGTTDGTDAVEGHHAVQHNKLALFMAAAENELGADPSATFTSVAARLNARLTCRTTADQALAANTTALTNVTNMVLPVATTGLDYYFKFLVAFSMATIATAGLLVFRNAGGREPLVSHWQTTKDPLLEARAVDEVESAERTYLSSIENLSRLAQPRLAGATSPVLMNYREKLDVLDSAITELKASIEQNRYNTHLRRELLAMYKEKQQTLQNLMKEVKS